MFSLGTLSSEPVALHPEMVAAPTLAALERLGWTESVGVVEIDPEVSDTAASQERVGLPRAALANPIGLPAAWPILADLRVVETPVVLIGSGVRRSKLLLPGALLGRLPQAEVTEDLGLPLAGT